MKRYVLAILFVGLFVVQGYSQDNQPPSGQDTPQVATETPALAPAASEKSAQPEEISIYGEIKAVNPTSNSITVQYYDYDSDQEKSIEITADTNTKIENAATNDASPDTASTTDAPTTAPATESSPKSCVNSTRW